LPLSRAARLTAAAVFVAGTPALPASAQTATADSAAPAPPPRPHRSHAATQATAPEGGTIAAIRVEGNQRIEPGTILSYMTVQPGDTFDPDKLDRSLKTLYATGLFSDVSLDRVGDTLVVRVAENPIVNQIAFEGNHKETEEDLRNAIQLRPRAVFTPAEAEADRDRLLALYAQKGRFAAQVTPKLIRLSDNRVNVVFEIKEGRASVIARIVFVGNHAFTEARLRQVISSRETAWWRFLSSSDEYDADRTNYDRELLRRFYLRNGYIDFAVDESHAELSPDRGGFFVTFTIHEGQRYRIGKISIHNQLPHLDARLLHHDLAVRPGQWYDGDAVERTVTALSDDLRGRGYAFIDVEPRIVRLPGKPAVDLVFDVLPGDRVYVERIDIVGNTRTQDKVLRREFRLAEGDAYDAELVRRTKQRLQDLGYFGKVTIDTSQGSAPDKAVLTTTVTEKSTGSLSLGGGYSTQVGALLNSGLTEKNFIGSGVDAGINGTLGTLENQLDLSVTDPYFLDKNLVAGFDIFHIDNSNQYYTVYSERRTGATVNIGYQFNEYVRQTWNYTIVDRNVYNAYSGASVYITSQLGRSVLSQIGQVFTIDHRDSRLRPHKGWILRLGADYAGLGGTESFVRGKIDGSYFIPLDAITHTTDWDLEFSAGVGKLWDIGSSQERIIDRFFLGGDNLRGFQPAGVGPRDLTDPYEDAIGGRFIWTQSTELHYPLPVPPDFGVTGRAFVDVGALSGYTRIGDDKIIASSAPRMGAGVGVSWDSPFGLINIDIADAILKQPHDKPQVFRFGFGTGF
jgi:outer membrane protein insertion porin family